MVKICQTGLLTLNFEIIPKNRIFRFLPKISAGHAWSRKFFFANFQILGPLGCQGWVVIPQNVKKSQNHCILMYTVARQHSLAWEGVGGYKSYDSTETLVLYTVHNTHFITEAMKYNVPPPIAASLILMANNIKKKPGRKAQYEGLSFHWAPRLWNIMSPTPPIAASLILPTKLMLYRENPAKFPSLAKNPPKYTAAYIVQQSNCRWHVWTFMFIRLGLNNKKSIHTLPLWSAPFLSLHLKSLPFQTLRLISLVSLITKT
jgi:hypothetical protein